MSLDFSRNRDPSRCKCGSDEDLVDLPGRGYSCRDCAGFYSLASLIALLLLRPVDELITTPMLDLVSQVSRGQPI